MHGLAEKEGVLMASGDGDSMEIERCPRGRGGGGEARNNHKLR